MCEIFGFVFTLAVSLVLKDVFLSLGILHGLPACWSTYFSALLELTRISFLLSSFLCLLSFLAWSAFGIQTRYPGVQLRNKVRQLQICSFVFCTHLEIVRNYFPRTQHTRLTLKEFSCSAILVASFLTYVNVVKQIPLNRWRHKS